MAGLGKGYDTTIGYLRLDVRALHRRECLHGVTHIRLNETRIALEHTPCTYGGTRPWFLCPVCERRVAILYLKHGRFGCRHCQRLNYKSQRESDQDRRFRRAEAIRERLGWPPGIANGHGPKPKGMRWHTFERLVAEHDAVADAIFAETDRWARRVLAGKGA